MNIDDLKAKALAADPGPHHICTHPRDSNKYAENQAFHDACSPQIILQLIAVLDVVSAERDALLARIKEAEKQEPAQYFLRNTEYKNAWVSVSKETYEARKNIQCYESKVYYAIPPMPAQKQEPVGYYVSETFIKYPAPNIESIKIAAERFGYGFAELYAIPPIQEQKNG